jgi:hypothetical protein
MKSSFFVWYCAVHLGDPDLYVQLQANPELLPFPKSGDELFNSLAADVDNIVLKERKFLTDVNRQASREDLDESEREKLKQKHNRWANRACLNIDKRIYKFLDISAEAVRSISEALRKIDLTDFGALDELEKDDS